MRGFLKKGYDLNYSQSMAPCISDGHSWWLSMDSQVQQSSVSRNLSFKMASPLDCYHSTKQLHLHFQDQESSSTQSTGQSCSGEGSLEINGYGKSEMSNQPRILYCGGHAKSEEDQSKSTISFQDSGLSFSSIDYRQYASVPSACPDPYHREVFVGYGPYSVVPPLNEIPSIYTRVLLPPDAAQDEPIYVNAKQIRAILRRRESRAKLVAQNKLPKVRKPYLHESRHLHALKRARGSGGRFLNSKKLQESKGIVKTSGENMSSPFQLQLKTPTTVSEVHQKQKHNEVISKTKTSSSEMIQNHSEGISKTTCSDTTATLNSECIPPSGFQVCYLSTSKCW